VQHACQQDFFAKSAFLAPAEKKLRVQGIFSLTRPKRA
jgi:hypothetical protein